jgi:hypothetical protein
MNYKLTNILDGLNLNKVDNTYCIYDKFKVTERIDCIVNYNSDEKLTITDISKLITKIEIYTGFKCVTHNITFDGCYEHIRVELTLKRKIKGDDE